MIVPQSTKLDRHKLRFSLAPAQKSQFSSLLNCLRRGDCRTETLACITREQLPFHPHNHISFPQNPIRRRLGSHRGDQDLPAVSSLQFPSPDPSSRPGRSQVPVVSPIGAVTLRQVRDRRLGGQVAQAPSHNEEAN